MNPLEEVTASTSTTARHRNSVTSSSSNTSTISSGNLDNNNNTYPSNPFTKWSIVSQPQVLLRSLKYTELWQNRKITNFEYLVSKSSEESVHRVMEAL
jgi:hypothetical protein